MRSTLQLNRLRRISTAGEIWDVQFEPGLNLIIGPQNSSKTSTLTIIDFCFGDDKSPSGKFSSSIAREYDRFELNTAINGDRHTMTRVLQQRGLLTATDVDGQKMGSESFNDWIIRSLNWPSIRIPRGLSVGTVTEEVPLSFRTIFRHLYRRADSWTQFASKEWEHHRRATFAFLLGLAEEIYTVQGKRVAIARLEAELRALEDRRRDLLSTLNEVVIQLTEGFRLAEVTSLAALDDVLEVIEGQVQALASRREELARLARAEPGYDEQLDAQLQQLNDAVQQLMRDESDLSESLRDQRQLIQVLNGDKARIDRAILSKKAFDSILVTTCPACSQALRPPASSNRSPGERYVCGQSVHEDTRARRLDLESRAVVSEIEELDEVAKGLESRGAEARRRRINLESERTNLLETIERERREFVSPLLREFEQIQFELGKLEQRQQLVVRLSGLDIRVDNLQQEVDRIENRLSSLRSELTEQPQSRGTIVERTRQFSDAMNDFVSRLPMAHGIGGLISVDPDDLTFYVGREPWENALGEERRVVFLLAYQYAFLRIAPEPDVLFPGLTLIDNPFQQDVPVDLVESALELFSQLCQERSNLQVVITTRRELLGLMANRIYYSIEFNPED